MYRPVPEDLASTDRWCLDWNMLSPLMLRHHVSLAYNCEFLDLVLQVSMLLRSFGLAAIFGPDYHSPRRASPA